MNSISRISSSGSYAAERMARESIGRRCISPDKRFGWRRTSEQLITKGTKVNKGVMLPEPKHNLCDPLCPLWLSFLKASSTPTSVFHLDPQLPQLRVAHRGGAIHNHVNSLGCFWKWDNLAQTLCPSQNHDNGIRGQGDPAVRRRTVLQRFKEKAEARFRLFLAHPQRTEDLLLHILTVNANRARAQLGAVHDNVVGQGAYGAQVLVRQNLFHIALVWRGKGMMRRHPVLALFLPLEHGEIGDPQQMIGLGVFEITRKRLVAISVFFRQAQAKCSRSLQHARSAEFLNSGLSTGNHDDKITGRTFRRRTQFFFNTGE